MTDPAISTTSDIQLAGANRTYRRNRAVDGWRGLAVVLMVAAHAELILLGSGTFNDSAGRLAMPLFMVIAGACYSRLSLRFALVLAAGCLVQPVLSSEVGATPGILLVFALLVPLFPVASRWPLPVAVLALVQVLSFPLTWDGYQPGALLLAWVIGRLASDHVRALPRVPAFLEVVGRWPLSWYVVHLYALLFVSRLTNIA